MKTLSNIIVSTKDMARLEALLDAIPGGPGKAQQGLLDELDRADIRNPDEMPPNVVTMNSTVRFAMDAPPSELCLTLVYPEEAHGQDCVSVLAPVGSALLGLCVGASIDWPRPGGGIVNIRILEVVAAAQEDGKGAPAVDALGAHADAPA
jgi:regulator of nucleoside diphosphate kinase